MSLASIVVRRPVTGTMFYLAIFLMGMIAWFLTPRELFPNISFPQLLIITRYGNAAPEEIENLCTKPIEESVGTVPNLKRVRSISKEGVSLVTLEFNWGTDMGFAHLAAREKIDQIKDKLPSEAEEPIINRINPFSQPMMIFSINGDLPIPVMTELTKRVVKQRLEKIPGVASAAISGGQEREIVVEADRSRVEAQGIALSGIVDSLKDTNLNYPAGVTQGKVFEYLVRTMGQFKNIGEIGRTVIKVDKPEAYDYGDRRSKRYHDNETRSSRLIYLESMADVTDTFKEITSYSRHNGRDNISAAIQKQADANTLMVARRIKAALTELRESLPPAMRLELIYNEADFIQESIDGLVTDSIVGGILAFMVLYAFLRSFSASFIAALTIPFATFFTFILMYFFHFSINLLSLAGVGLAIGSLVDNAIVCMENVTRHKDELKKDPVTAAIEGTQEVAMPMFSSALTNVAVFLPLIFAKGAAQKLFTDLFFTNTAATMGSWLIAITMIPQLITHPLPVAGLWAAAKAKVLVWRQSRAPVESGPAPRWKETARKWGRRAAGGIPDEVHHRWLEKYRSLLVWSIQNPKRLAIYIGSGVLASLVLLSFQNKVFMPQFDQGQFILRIEMPVGTRLDVTDHVMHTAEAVLKQIPAVTDVTVSVGSNNSEAVDALGGHQAQAIVDIDRKKASTEDVIAELKKTLEHADLQGAQVQYLLQGSVLASAFETTAPILIEVKGPDMTTLRKMSEDIMESIGTIKGVYGVKSSLALPSAETRVEVDKVRAASYQISTAEIARTALIGIKGFVATTYKEGGEEVDVRVRLRGEDRSDVANIGRLTVQSSRTGVLIPLSELTTIYTARGPSEIKHLDQQRAVAISANILKRSSSQVIEEVRQKIVPFQDTMDYHVSLSGESQQVRESFGGLVIAMIGGVLANYMIMAAEFENLWHPLIVMSTIPLGIIGVALSLFLTGTPLSAPVILGCIMLGGMVVNNGIILIDFTNVLRREGHELLDAVMKAATIRFRPIVMSNLTSVLGVLPLALGLSEGSELTSPMAVVSVGGLTVSAMLTLLMIPTFYYYWELWLSHRQAAQAGAPAAETAPAP